MKTVIALFAVLLLSTGMDAQTDFGIKGGLNFTFFKVAEAGFGANPETEVGFYGGVFADFNISNGFHIQPELLYIGLRDFRFLNAPIYLKYDINADFQILVGPSLNYFFDFLVNKVKVRADLSMAYNLSSRLDLHMKYTIGFEEISPNGLFLGLGYKL